MPSPVSKRILEAVDALPLYPGIRVIEVGSGPGVAAREINRRWPTAYVLGIDRSVKAVQQAVAGSLAQVKAGRLSFRHVAVEELELQPGERRYDLAFALRVGALDGRHPELEAIALSRLAACLSPQGRIFVDGGAPLRVLSAA
ncbi:class I SAM-dependent methyltransferase [Rubrivivax sp. RP6-9]|uniref:class I SAM-dependent methyltransferase n=1 Tax=Rubrivivax sp. RP6-9 TaxID=3415750 RepID=UPI003CC63CDF